MHLLRKMSSFNDDAQALFFDRTSSADLSESMITRPFRSTRSMTSTRCPRSIRRRIVSRLAGSRGRACGRSKLRALPRRKARLRGISASSWSAIGKWGGVRAADIFLARSGADTTAKYVAFECADNYSTSIDMPTALHAQTLLTLTLARCSAEVRLPHKLRMPAKLGYAESKHDRLNHRYQPISGGYWENQTP